MGHDCSRRAWIKSMIGGSILFPGIVSELLAGENQNASVLDPLAARPSHFSPKAKRMIFVFATGGVSHIDTFDPKQNGKDGSGKDKIMGSIWKSSRNERCGTEISDLFPHVREVADEICVIRSMKSAHFDHSEATLGMHSGSATFVRPCMGSWLSYGLGTMNKNLPSFIVIAPALPYGGTQVFANDFLPAYHQGTRVIPGADPVANLRTKGSRAMQETELGLSNALNQMHLKERAGDSILAARLKSFETAFNMQQAGADAFDLSSEDDKTLEHYGLKRGQNTGFGWQCVVARRLAERGVRVIELIDSGSGNNGSGNWDSHGDMKDHVPLARNSDRPLAALIQDLKRRGMLDDTLIVWATEFGRTPTKEGKLGRGHHGACFSVWMAGAGIKRGMVYGATDELGLRITEKPVDVHDFHATILHQLGIEHTKLTYRHSGRDYRLTDVHGNLLTEIMS
jgi:hypothetical protein